MTICGHEQVYLELPDGGLHDLEQRIDQLQHLQVCVCVCVSYCIRICLGGGGRAVHEVRRGTLKFSK